MCRFLLLTLLAVLLFPPWLFAQKVGDQIAVVAFSTPIKAGTEKIGEATAGDILKVEQIGDGP